MITEKDTIKCEAIFNDDRTHRFLLKRIWDKDKPMMAVIMLNPCLSDNIITDTTTSLVVNNVARLESYGGVQIVNLYSLLTSKLSFRWNSDEELNAPANDEYIKKAASECESILLAWGRITSTNERVSERAVNVINMLLKHKEKLMVISDGERSGLHPLTPSIRSQWTLEKVEFKTSDEVKTKITKKHHNENKTIKKDKKESEGASPSFEIISDKKEEADEKIVDKTVGEQ